MNIYRFSPAQRLLTGLTAGLLLTLMACGPGGDAPDTMPPATPTGLKATGKNQLSELLWTANTESDLAGYTIQYGQSAQALNKVVQVDKNNSSQVVNNLTNGTTYFFAIKATDTSGNSSPLSQVVSAIPQGTSDTTPPARPSQVMAVAGNAQVRLTWLAGSESDLKQYVVKYGIAENALNRTATVDAGEVRAGQMITTIGSLTNETPYFFTVTAQDQAGNTSTSSDSVSATPTAPGAPDTTPPATPTGLVATAGNTVIDLSWTANTESDLKEYVLAYFAGNVAPGEPQVIRIPIDQTSYRLSGLTNGTMYSMTLAAIDQRSNASPTTRPVTATPSGANPPPTDTTPPAVPQGLTVQPTSQPKELQVNWQANTESDLKDYRVTYREGGSTQSVIVVKPLRDVVLKNLKDTTEYSVSVEAVDTSGNRSAPSTTVKATTRDPNQAPFVKNYSPLTTSVGVPTDAEVSVEFSREMNRQSVEQALKLTANNQTVTPSVTWRSNRVMKFKPVAGYAYGAEVQWQLDTSARSADGAAPNGIFEAHFRVVRVKTETIPFDRERTGYVRYQPTPVIGGYDVSKGDIRVGDLALIGLADWQYRGFASFDLSSLPNDVVRLVEASLISQRSYVAGGNPFESLGKLQLHRVKVHSPLRGDDFNAIQQNCVFPGSGESFTCYRSVDQIGNAQSFDVLDMVASDWAERDVKGKNSSFRFRFTSNSSDNGMNDYIWVTTPSLNVRYEYP